eukprot:gnl/TRDRNA2_/TRDRNA2_151579_c0_seq3.p1 gnl/TRDRNA2_/TRDRNA2_151579_c0~~gnl/TRDRNA2_/TRDRNA2_151579_c0_seq3.p1  ORF type:complete len:253 (+),score=9.98 gnl/TRDRNA2_/TRDRNA2_151579_c0_seq3:2-760(+)
MCKTTFYRMFFTSAVLWDAQQLLTDALRIGSPNIWEQRLQVKHPIRADFEDQVASIVDSKTSDGFFNRVREEALSRRFVRWNESNLSRGLMSGNHTAGRAAGFPYDLYLGSQGEIGQFYYKGVPMMKMSWDLQLYSMLLTEVKPATLIELGSGYGASAIWFADQVNALHVPCQVHSFDIWNVSQERKILFEKNTFHSEVLELLRTAPSNVHYHVADARNEADSFSAEMLHTLPHPWVVIAHERGRLFHHRGY